MNLSELEETARERTEAILGAWTARPTGQTKLITDQYKKAFNEIDQLLKDLYAKSLTGIKPEDYYNYVIQKQRLENLQKQIASLYSQAARKAGLGQVELSKTAISNLYYNNMYAINWFSRIDNNTFFTVLNKNVIDVSVFGTPKIWESIKKANRPGLLPYQPQHGTLLETLLANKEKDLIKIRQAITQGLIQGKSYTATSKEIKGIFNITANNALRIARTEGNRNLNAGAYANTQAAQEAGINLKRRYLATLDTRTRPQSGQMDGQEVLPNEPFVYPNGEKAFIVGNSGVPRYDINDRCTSIDIIDDLDPQLRTGRDPATGETRVTSYRSFDKWMKDNSLTRTKSGKITTK